jgi:hypothetical protein
MLTATEDESALLMFFYTGGTEGHRLCIRDGSVYDLIPMPYYNLLLASGETGLHFIDVSDSTR